MGTFFTDFMLIMMMFIIATGIAAVIAVEYANYQAKKRYAELGDQYGSFEHDGKWYVIKREGE